MSGIFSIVGGVGLVGILGAQIIITMKIGAEGRSCEKRLIGQRSIFE